MQCQAEGGALESCGRTDLVIAFEYCSTLDYSYIHLSQLISFCSIYVFELIHLLTLLLVCLYKSHITQLIFILFNNYLVFFSNYSGICNYAALLFSNILALCLLCNYNITFGIFIIHLFILYIIIK